MKLCIKCNQTKDFESFYKSERYKDGCKPVCKICQIERATKWRLENPDRARTNAKRSYKKRLKREKIIPKYKLLEMNNYNKKWKKNNYEATRSMTLKYSYGITIEDYNQMFEQQKGLCLICNKPETIRNKRAGKVGEIKNLVVDHCHKTGKIRGLLCMNCNQGIGKLQDDINLLQKAIEYLKKYLC